MSRCQQSWEAWPGRRNTIRAELAAFVVGGFGWAPVNVNSLPMVVDMTSLEKVGDYTGLYCFFSQAADIIAPPSATPRSWYRRDR